MDWLIALWVAGSGAAFVVCELAGFGEPAGGRFAYAGLAAVCLVSLALKAVRRVLAEGDNEA